MPAPTALTSPANVPQRKLPPGSGGTGPYEAPSVIHLGIGLQDPRLQYNSAMNGTTNGAGILGWLGNDYIKTTSQVPSAIATANIAALANVTNGTAMTLVSSTGSGITVLAAQQLVLAAGASYIPAGTLAIDGAPNDTNFSSSMFTALYNPATGISRAVSITGVSGGSGGNFLIKGYDWYGFPMSQLLTVGAGAVTANTTKTFKFIASVTPQFTDSHNYSVGTADIYGLQLAADFFADVDIYWNNVLQLTAQFTAAVTTSPATTTTGDVRGTFTAPGGTPSNGTVRLDVFVTPSLSRLATVPVSTGLFGVPQV